MQLEESIEKYSGAGLGVVAISYDTVEILKSFDDRMGGFSYSMLADPNSEIGSDGITEQSLERINCIESRA